jgi:hypothetical protein
VSAYKLGRRSSAFARYALLLFDDRVEEVSYTLAGLEVKRFFFDEADFMTVHRVSSTGEAFLALMASLGLGALAFASWSNPLGWPLAVAAVLMLALAVFVYLNPAHKLVLAAPDPETAECRLSRFASRREEAIGRLTRAVARYQSRTGRSAAPKTAEPPSVLTPGNGSPTSL